MFDVELVRSVAPMIVLVALAGVGGWVITTWLRVKHGYPLEGGSGETVYPRSSEETIERVRLIGSENAQLRAELSAVKDRLATVERIVTDGSYRLDREIDALRGPAN